MNAWEWKRFHNFQWQNWTTNENVPMRTQFCSNTNNLNKKNLNTFFPFTLYWELKNSFFFAVFVKLEWWDKTWSKLAHAERGVWIATFVCMRVHINVRIAQLTNVDIHTHQIDWIYIALWRLSHRLKKNTRFYSHAFSEIRMFVVEG